MDAKQKIGESEKNPHTNAPEGWLTKGLKYGAWCKCSKCGYVGRLTFAFNYYANNAGDPLTCEHCTSGMDYELGDTIVDFPKESCVFKARSYLSQLYGNSSGPGLRLHLFGGLSNLISIIGYFEKEITLGTYQKTKTAIVPHLPKIKTYYQFLGSRHETEANIALDWFLDLTWQEMRFWKDF